MAFLLLFSDVGREQMCLLKGCRVPYCISICNISVGLSDIDFLLGHDANMMRRSSALYLLKLKEQLRITQVAIDVIVEGSKGLFSATMNRAKASVTATLSEAGVNPNSIAGFSEAFDKVTDPFDKIDTYCLQEKYYRENLHLIVSGNAGPWDE